MASASDMRARARARQQAHNQALISLLPTDIDWKNIFRNLDQDDFTNVRQDDPFGLAHPGTPHSLIEGPCYMHEKLPVEMLAEIMAATVQDVGQVQFWNQENDFSDHVYKTVTTLRAVCKLWKATADVMSALWSRLDIRNPTAVRWCLDHCGALIPLHLRGHVEDENDDDVFIIREALLPSMDRLTTIHITGYEGSVNWFIRQFVEENTTFLGLETLSLEIPIEWGGEFGDPVVFHTPLNHPRLHTLSLVNVFLSTATDLSMVKNVHLTYTCCSFQVFKVFILPYLRSLRAVESLALFCHDYDPDSDHLITEVVAEAAKFPRVELPNLIEFTALDISAAALEAIHHIIGMPNVRKGEIYMACDVGEHNSLVDGSGFAAQLRDCTCGLEVKLHGTVSSGKLMESVALLGTDTSLARPTSCRCIVHANRDDYVSVSLSSYLTFVTVLSGALQSRITSLSISLQFLIVRQGDAARWGSFLQALPSLQTLRILEINAQQSSSQHLDWICSAFKSSPLVSPQLHTLFATYSTTASRGSRINGVREPHGALPPQDLEPLISLARARDGKVKLAICSRDTEGLKEDNDSEWMEQLALLGGELCEAA
ncbi:hypothetical protein EIP91_005830 [Steccherinum ochraceum]|uniref:F-box domain-containing protein n=1 Tax=Steccherinum ochraceum TaxID=92696 RepID=A0A4R0RHJ6_9APHY|nr:hypothetical protein EIP91_005830 [Steccherinum ochraceum]